jgi:hypothetical protein
VIDNHGHISDIKLTVGFFFVTTYNGSFLKFGVEVGVEESIVNAIYLRIKDHVSAV